MMSYIPWLKVKRKRKRKVAKDPRRKEQRRLVSLTRAIRRFV